MTVAPAYQVLADRIRVEIMSGQLRPGERLPTEPQLCEQSGLSRSTVREALRLLSSQHLIVTTRGVNGGSFVAAPDAHILGESLSDGVGLLLANGVVKGDDFLEVRRMLEVPAAGLAAVRREPRHLAELERAMFDPDRDDLDRRITAHAEFHLAVAAASGNTLLSLVVRPLYTVVDPQAVDRVAPLSMWREIDQDHRELLAAIRAGDVERAMAAARVHIDHVRPDLPPEHTNFPVLGVAQL
ncbi:FadR/GntR family transcriptional regulator [Dactylosporangium fulvum]|uniref:FCD domain-containing protein n=1 Tax=Dactylosporangium fulvum TaxID=53359 RepID=A0ABY5W2Y3_9ACTN|nr:FCD domain-containing protein [Dactylosporangium fulvum]UWP83799.1 FCD domain-containing protein [Dactylosporangium fulvum]